MTAVSPVTRLRDAVNAGAEGWGIDTRLGQLDQTWMSSNVRIDLWQVQIWALKKLHSI